MNTRIRRFMASAGMMAMFTLLISSFAYAQPVPTQSTRIILPLLANGGRPLAVTIDAVRQALLLREQMEATSAGGQLSSYEESVLEEVALAVTQNAPDAQTTASLTMVALYCPLPDLSPTCRSGGDNAMDVRNQSDTCSRSSI